MDKRINRDANRHFERSAVLLEGLPAESVAQIVSTGSDITILMDEDGIIRDVACHHFELDDYGAANWIGKHWLDTVTPESTGKIEALLNTKAHGEVSQGRQVNHAAKGMPDLPVTYRVIRPIGSSVIIAFGEAMHRIAEIQQKLVNVQLELERDYRKVRETESRYRSIFYKAMYPIVVVRGDDFRVLDANQHAVKLCAKGAGELSGTPAASLFAKEHRERAKDALKAAHLSGQMQSLELALAASGKETGVAVEPFREGGSVNMIVHFLVDREPGAEQSERLKNGGWVRDFPEALVITDEDGVILTVNNRFLDLVHALNDGAITGRNIDNWVGASTVDMSVLRKRLREEGKIQRFSTIVRNELGATTDVALSGSLTEDENRKPIVVISMSDQLPGDQRIAIHPPGEMAATSDFSELVGRVPLKDLIREASDVIEKLCIEAALRQTGNNRASAADLLGLSRQSLYIKLRRHGLEDFDAL